MKSQSITNLATPSASTDGANKTYVDTLDGQNVKLTGTQTIAGTKEFSGILATSLGVPCIIGRNTKGTAATRGLELYGTSGNLNGPHIQAFIHSSVYPIFQQLNWSSDNINLVFDAYYDGANWKSSNSGSNFLFTKGGNKLSFNYASGITVGNNITWTEAMNISTAGVITGNSGAKISIQGATDGTSARGIYMWDIADTNWGIYMATSGAGKSLSGGTAPAGNGFSSHAIRFKANNTSSNGFIWENSANNAAMSLRGSDGFLWCSGGFQTDNSITINNSGAQLYFTDGSTTTCGIRWSDDNHCIFCKRNTNEMYFKEYGSKHEGNTYKQWYR